MGQLIQKKSRQWDNDLTILRSDRVWPETCVTADTLPLLVSFRITLAFRWIRAAKMQNNDIISAVTFCIRTVVDIIVIGIVLSLPLRSCRWRETRVSSTSPILIKPCAVTRRTLSFFLPFNWRLKWLTDTCQALDCLIAQLYQCDKECSIIVLEAFLLFLLAFPVVSACISHVMYLFKFASDHAGFLALFSFDMLLTTPFFAISLKKHFGTEQFAWQKLNDNVRPVLIIYFFHYLYLCFFIFYFFHAGCLGIHHQNCQLEQRVKAKAILSTCIRT